MEKEIFVQALSNGVFAGLFVWLLFYVLKENGKREERYQKLLEELSKNYECLKDAFCVFKDDFSSYIKKHTKKELN